MNHPPTRPARCNQAPRLPAASRSHLCREYHISRRLRPPHQGQALLKARRSHRSACLHRAHGVFGDRVFIAPCEEWARRAASGEAGWAWVKSAPVERGMATALRMIQAAGLGGKVARLSQLASLCRRAPLYGPDSREAVIFGWADTPTLALAIVPQDVRDTSTLEALSTLVNHRRDEMLPTLFISTSTGAAYSSPAPAKTVPKRPSAPISRRR